VLATIALSNLSAARLRAKDILIKATFSQVRVQGELESGGYGSLCDSGVKTLEMFKRAHDVGGSDTTQSNHLYR